MNILMNSYEQLWYGHERYGGDNSYNLKQTGTYKNHEYTFNP